MSRQGLWNLEPSCGERQLCTNGLTGSRATSYHSDFAQAMLTAIVAVWHSISGNRSMAAVSLRHQSPHYYCTVGSSSSWQRGAITRTSKCPGRVPLAVGCVVQLYKHALRKQVTAAAQCGNACGGSGSSASPCASRTPACTASRRAARPVRRRCPACPRQSSRRLARRRGRQ